MNPEQRDVPQTPVTDSNNRSPTFFERVLEEWQSRTKDSFNQAPTTAVPFPASYMSIIIHGLKDITSSHHVRVCVCLTSQFAFYSRADSGINLLAEDVEIFNDRIRTKSSGSWKKLCQIFAIVPWSAKCFYSKMVKHCGGVCVCVIPWKASAERVCVCVNTWKASAERVCVRVIPWKASKCVRVIPWKASKCVCRSLKDEQVCVYYSLKGKQVCACHSLKDEQVCVLFLERRASVCVCYSLKDEQVCACVIHEQVCVCGIPWKTSKCVRVLFPERRASVCVCYSLKDEQVCAWHSWKGERLIGVPWPE